jgi:hypothetical protein
MTMLFAAVHESASGTKRSFASEPEAVAPDYALGFESPPNSRPSMVC